MRIGEVHARAQASVFLAALRVEIDGVSAEIEKASAAGDRALRNGYQVAHRRYVDAEATARKKLYELHRLVDNLRSRFPELEPSTRNLRDTSR